MQRKKYDISPLTHNRIVVLCPQLTCQASAPRGMLKLGRSLLFQGVAA
jgi:hypothetical protein